MAASRILAFVPKLWNDTIEAHRREVRDAILDATAALVHEHGLAAVTMSQIAADTGIGRATLYKYFPDVEAILVAWHERHVGGHLEHLSQLATEAGSARARLGAVLEAYAMIMHHRHEPELSSAIRDGFLTKRREALRSVLDRGVSRGDLRADLDTELHFERLLIFRLAPVGMLLDEPE